MEAFDFATPPGLPAHAAASLGPALEAATARTGLLLTSMLRREATLQAHDARRASGASLSTDVATWFVLDVGSPAGIGVLVFPARAVVQLADVLMGGPGAKADRMPTALERGIVAARLASGFAPLVTGVIPDAKHCTLHAVDAGSVPLAGDLVCIPIALTLGTVETTFDFALPYALVAVDDGIDGRAPDEDVLHADPAVVDALSFVPVPVAVRFAPVHVPAAELEGLAVGDVIRLEHSSHDPLVGDVGGRPFFLAWPGRRGRRLAIQIQQVVEG